MIILLNYRMEFGDNFENKLKKFIEKYGKREIPLEHELECNTSEENGENGENEEFDENDLRQYEYHFHYDKRKDEVFAFNENFKIKKEKNNKHEYKIIIFDEKIAENFREILENPDLFSEVPEIDMESLYYCINDLRIKYKLEKFNNEHVKRLLDFTEELFRDKYVKIDNMLNEGIIDFDSLWYHLDKVDTFYIVKHLEEDICFKHKHFYRSVDSKGDDVLILAGSVIAPYDGVLNIYEMEYRFNKFTGNKKIDTLKIAIMKEEDKEKFTGYGERVVELSKKISHMYVAGKHYVRQDRNIVAIDRHERVMVDYEGMSKYANSPYDFSLQKTLDADSVLTNEDKLTIFPFACIYNLGINKGWGITHVKNLQEITYKKDAFDYLVLEQNKKTLVKALITNKIKSDKLKDFIETKGNGLIFLLYGPPGTGKTLTAEATCEYLGKPLYNVNVGDLGTDPEHMEEIMNMVLVYSKRWDSIVVIDEVDIFLEERETNMIARNAMVGIFLKLLEYHDGIIFLTTNRLQSLDGAVKSRINLMLSFKELTQDRRLKIWGSLFGKWNIKLKDTTLRSLSEYKLNGREIRNYIKLVVAVHEDQNKEITDVTFIKELENCFNITEEFNAMIGETNKMYT